MIEIDYYFDVRLGDPVYEIFNPVFSDDRGWFNESLHAKFIDGIKQVNRSCSKPGVLRGCHAQRGPFCQAKLVEAVNTNIIDVITDARPVSKTFGKSKMYLLDAKKQNKLYVPKGFLHAFIVPHTAGKLAYFNYYCYNLYDKQSEICVNPIEVVKPLFEQTDWSDPRNIDFLTLKDEAFGNFEECFTISEKDRSGMHLDDFLNSAVEEYRKGKLWYE